MLTSQEGFLIAIVAVFFVLVFTTRLKIELLAILVLLTVSAGGLVTTQWGSCPNSGNFSG